MKNTTPKRLTNSTSAGFSPVVLPQSPAAASPQKNLTGVPRVVRDLIADLYNNIQRWNDVHIKGASIVKEIAELKAERSEAIPPELHVLTNGLYADVNTLRQYRDTFTCLASQIDATTRLYENGRPLFISLSVDAIAKLVKEITSAYEAEYNEKLFLLENIAYSRNKDEAMFMAALWTYQRHVTDNINLKLEVLLVETGHRKVN